MQAVHVEFLPLAMLLLDRLPTRPRVVTALWLALAFVTAEAARMPVGYTTPYRTPAVYQFLANQPDAVLVELPLYSPGQVFFNSRYMLHSTRHWRPILNGYSGFTPRSYVTHIPADACAARLMSWRRA